MNGTRSAYQVLKSRHMLFVLLFGVFGVVIGALSSWEISNPIGLFAGLGFFFTIILKPSLSLATYLAYIPFHLIVYYKVVIGSNVIVAPVGSTFSPLAGLKDALFLTILTVWFIGLLKGIYGLPKKALPLPLLVFWGLAIVYASISPDWRAGVWGLRLFIFSISYLVAASLYKHWEKITSSIVKAVLISSIPVLAYGAYVAISDPYIGQFTRVEGVPFDVLVRLSVFSGLNTPNVFGMYLSVVILLAIGSLFLLGLDKLYKIVCFVILPIVILELFLTFSRRSWLGVLAGLMVMLILTRRYRVLLYSGISLLVLLFTARLLFPQAMTLMPAHLRTFVQLDSGWNTGRLSEWSMLLNRVAGHYFLGEGLGVISAVGETFGIPGSTIGHNYFIILLVQMGLPGLLVFTWFLGLNLMQGLKLAKSSVLPGFRGMVVTLLSVIVALTVESFFGSGIEGFPFNMYFWTFSGLLMSAGSYHKLAKGTEHGN